VSPPTCIKPKPLVERKEVEQTPEEDDTGKAVAKTQSGGLPLSKKPSAAKKEEVWLWIGRMKKLSLPRTDG
jgi:hypothetical protein